MGLDNYGTNTTPFANPFYVPGPLYDIWAWECTFSPLNFRRLLNGRPPVIYNEVTVYDGDIGGYENYTPENTNGKTVYKYSIYDNFLQISTQQYHPAFFELPYFTINGIGKEAVCYDSKNYRYNTLTKKSDYGLKGLDYIPLSKEEYFSHYIGLTITQLEPLEAYPYCYQPHGGELWGYQVACNFIFKDEILGIRLLGSKKITLYSPSGDSIINDEGYEYNSVYQIISKTSQNSDNKYEKTKYYYPKVSSSGPTPPIIQSMLDKNIISPIIESTRSIGDSYWSINEEISGYKTDFNEFPAGSSTIIMPAKAYELEITPSGSDYVLRNEITSYSSNGNPLEYVSKDGIKSAYIWGYNDRYMIAKAEKAAYKDIFSDSFEESGGTADANSKTGSKVRISNYSTTRTNLTNGSYILSYWKRTNGIWSLISTAVSVSSGSYTINITASSTYPVDEVRFYPAGALMTTYTYDPLIGVTSITDDREMTTYYKYDNFGRLKYIRDFEGNVLQRTDYNYAQ